MDKQYLDTISQGLFDTALKLKYKRSLYEFLKAFWNTAVKDTFIDNWHIEYICNELQIVGERVIKRLPKLYDLVINVPPGTSKSTICSVMFPVWLWINDPSIRIISSSYSHDLSLSHTLKSRDIITSDKFRDLFEIELRSDKSGKSNYQNIDGGERISTSTGGTIIGKHGHVIITDDPSNTTQALSTKERVNSINHLTSTLETRTTDPKVTPIIIVMQRLHESDVSGYVLKNYKNVKHICFPATATKDIKPIECKDNYVNGYFDINRFPEEVLQQKKERLGANQYAGQFLQTPKMAEAAFFKLENSKYFEIKDNVIITETERVDLNTCIKIFTIDLAITTNKTSDYTVISYFAIDKQNNIYLLDCYRERVEGADHVNLIENWYGKYKPTVVGIESVAYQKSLCQEMIRRGLPVKELRPDKSKETRAWTAAQRHEQGTIYFNRNVNNLTDLENEMIMFPNGEYDDFVDTLSYAVEYMLNEIKPRFVHVDVNRLKDTHSRVRKTVLRPKI